MRAATYTPLSIQLPCLGAVKVQTGVHPAACLKKIVWAMGAARGACDSQPDRCCVDARSIGRQLKTTQKLKPNRQGSALHRLIPFPSRPSSAPTAPPLVSAVRCASNSTAACTRGRAWRGLYLRTLPSPEPFPRAPASTCADLLVYDVAAAVAIELSSWAPSQSTATDPINSISVRYVSSGTPADFCRHVSVSILMAVVANDCKIACSLDTLGHWSNMDLHETGCRFWSVTYLTNDSRTMDYLKN